MSTAISIGGESEPFIWLIWSFALSPSGTFHIGHGAFGLKNDRWHSLEETGLSEPERVGKLKGRIIKSTFEQMVSHCCKVAHFGFSSIWKLCLRASHPVLIQCHAGSYVDVMTWWSDDLMYMMNEWTNRGIRMNDRMNEWATTKNDKA